MSGKKVWILLIAMLLAVSTTPMVVSAGGDKNTNRGSEGDQIGEPAPDPAQDPDQPRDGDPNPDMENIPEK